MPIRAADWSDAFFDSVRRVGDPLADEVVESLFVGGDLTGANELLRTLLRNDQVPLDRLPTPVRDYLAASKRLPSWMDKNRVETGRHIFARHGPLNLLVLACASLPACYVQGNEARVLGLTQRLQDHATRRILETAQFLIDVMTPDAFATQGRAIRTVQKVRLMHAAIRYLIEAQPDTQASAEPTGFGEVLQSAEWPTAERGKPICQEDLAYTLQTFAWVTLNALDKLGVEDYQPGEREAFVHLWNVIGFLLGIDERLLPSSEHEAGQLFESIQRRQREETDDGKRLTAAVTEFIRVRMMDFGFNVPAMRSSLPRMLIRELVPPENAELIGVRALNWKEWLASKALFESIDAVVDWGGFVVGRGHIGPYLWRKASAHIVRKLTELPRGWERGLFEIPDTLRAEWAASGAV